MKRAMFVAAVALFAAPAALAAPARTHALTSVCPYAPIVVNVTQTVANEYARGAFGNPFAIQSSTRTLVVFRTGPHSFCALTNARGTFSTLAGVSPAGTSAVNGGTTGPFSQGTGTQIFNATW